MYTSDHIVYFQDSLQIKASFALNGGIEGRAVTVNTDMLTFSAVLTPFIQIPNNTLNTVSGQSVTVFWTSNLCEKNGEAETVFTTEVIRGTDTVHSTSSAGTASAPAASVTIPGDCLNYDYSAGAENTFTVRISAEDNGAEYTASASISLESKPAVVTLNKLPAYYVTDGADDLRIGWTIENFDQYSDEAENLFKFEVTRNGTPVYSTVSPGSGTGSGTFTDSYPLHIDLITASADDPTSYRQVYTVTIQAKNGSSSAWSYDSLTALLSGVKI